MRSPILLFACLSSTAVVLHTAVQIEHKNMLCDGFLPRFPSDVPVPRWEIPELKSVLESLDDRFFVRREQSALSIASESQAGDSLASDSEKPELEVSEVSVSKAAKLLAETNSATADSSDAADSVEAPKKETAPASVSAPAEVHYGPPYSEHEQRSIDSMTRFHASLIKLRWWVSGFGIAQYFLAPTALVLTLVSAFLLRGVWRKSTAVLCACLCFGCIFLMLLRGYWHAMGVDELTFTFVPFVNNLFV